MTTITAPENEFASRSRTRGGARLPAGLRVVLALCGVMLLAPWYVGGEALDRIQGYIHTMDEMPGYQARIVAVERGWLSSRVSWNFSAASGELQLATEVEHGPWLFDEHGWLGPARVVITADDPERGQTRVDVRLHASRDADITASMEAFTNREVVFDGARGRFRWHAADHRLQGELTAPGVAIVDGSSHLAFSNVALDVNMHRWNGVLDVGAASLAVGEVHIMENGQDVRMRGLDIESNVYVNDDETTLTAGFRYAMDDLYVNDSALHALVLDVAYRRFDADVIMRVAERLGALVAVDSDDPAAVLADLVPGEDLRQLLGTSPALEINQLSFRLGDGPTTLSAIASFDGHNLPASLPLLDAAFWLERVDVEAFIVAAPEVAHLLASEVMRERAPGIQADTLAPVLLDTLVDSGLLLSAQDGYRMRFEMLDGRALLNNRPIPREQLAGQQLMAALW